MSELALHCVDTWEGGVEHQRGGIAQTDMRSVEERFRHNTAAAIARAPCRVTLTPHKACSGVALAALLASGKKGYFDFVYVDGSHQAPDVLCDALLGFKLLRVGGVMAFDDYLWAEDLPTGRDPIRCPKPAIDTFTNLFCRKPRVMSAPGRRLAWRAAGWPGPQARWSLNTSSHSTGAASASRQATGAGAPVAGAGTEGATSGRSAAWRSTG